MPDPTLADNLLPLIQHYQEQYRHLAALAEAKGPRAPAHPAALLSAVADDYAALREALAAELADRLLSNARGGGDGRAFAPFAVAPTLLGLPDASRRRIGATYRKAVHVPPLASCGSNVCLSESMGRADRQLEVERAYFEDGELVVRP